MPRASGECRALCSDGVPTVEGLPGARNAAATSPTELFLAIFPAEAELFELFIENDGDLARLAAGHKSISFVRLLERKSIGNEIFGMNFPANDSFHQDLPSAKCW